MLIQDGVFVKYQVSLLCSYENLIFELTAGLLCSFFHFYRSHVVVSKRSVLLPQEPPRNQLFNYLIDLLQEKQLFFDATAIESSGSNLVKVVQSCPLPPVFGVFTGYNVPECKALKTQKCKSFCRSAKSPFSFHLWHSTRKSSNLGKTSTRKWNCLL